MRRVAGVVSQHGRRQLDGEERRDGDLTTMDDEERRERDGDVDTAGGGSNKGQRVITL